MKNYSVEMFFAMRPQSAVQPSGISTGLSLWNVLVPDLWWLEDVGNDITNRFEGPDNGHKGHGLVTLNHLAHPKSTGRHLPSFYFTSNTAFTCTTEASHDDSYGGRQLNRCTNLVLKMLFKKGNAYITNGTSYFIDVWSSVHNNIIFSNSEIRRYLN
jgi:hypothetical protein